MSQPVPEKTYTPPGAAPAQVPGQYTQYPQPGQYQNYQQAQPPQYQNQQYPQGQYNVQHAPNPQYQQPQPQYVQQQPYPQGQYQHQQYPSVQVQPPPQVVQNGYSQQAQPQFQTHPHPQPYPQAQPYTTVVVQQQPLPVIGMTVSSAGGNRNVKNVPVNPMGKREWSNGFCNCFDDCGTCMLGCFCPCMLYAQIKQRLDYLNMYARPDPTQGGSGVDINCMVWCMLHLVTGCGFALQAINRGHLRNRYMIDGNGCSDVCAAMCCTPCELTQEHRELDLEEQSLRK